MTDCAHEMKKSKIGHLTVYRCIKCKELFSQNPNGAYRPFKIVVSKPPNDPPGSPRRRRTDQK
jgi:hypothetical protein